MGLVFVRGIAGAGSNARHLHTMQYPPTWYLRYLPLHQTTAPTAPTARTLLPNRVPLCAQRLLFGRADECVAR